MSKLKKSNICNPKSLNFKVIWQYNSADHKSMLLKIIQKSGPYTAISNQATSESSRKHLHHAPDGALVSLITRTMLSFRRLAKDRRKSFITNQKLTNGLRLHQCCSQGEMLAAALTGTKSMSSAANKATKFSTQSKASALSFSLTEKRILDGRV